MYVWYFTMMAGWVRGAFACSKLFLQHPSTDFTAFQEKNLLPLTQHLVEGTLWCGVVWQAQVLKTLSELRAA